MKLLLFAGTSRSTCMRDVKTAPTKGEEITMPSVTTTWQVLSKTDSSALSATKQWLQMMKEASDECLLCRVHHHFLALTGGSWTEEVGIARPKKKDEKTPLQNPVCKDDNGMKQALSKPWRMGQKSRRNLFSFRTKDFRRVIVKSRSCHTHTNYSWKYCSRSSFFFFFLFFLLLVLVSFLQLLC